MPQLVCTTHSGLDHSHYATTRAYLQDIDQGLEQFYRNIVNNQVELDKYIPQSLQNTAPARDLLINTDAEFTTDQVRPSFME